MDSELINFATVIREDVSTAAAVAGDAAASQTWMLTQIFVDDLSSNGEIENAEAVHYQTGTMHVSGYGLSDAGDRLDLFVTVLTGSVPPVTVPAVEVRSRFRQLRNFLQRSLSTARPLHTTIDGGLPARDMAMRILEHRELLSRVRLHLFTDGLVRDQAIDDASVASLQVSQHVWDIRRLYRNQAHLHQPEPIVIDLQGTYGQSLPCLEMPGGGQDYGACLTIFPGTVLGQIYRDHGPRLLERNVRSFLQASGGINRGIRQTILREPGRFLAYNNGISATASRIDLVDLPDGRRAVSRIHDFQIVNGGQTTASLHRAMVRDRANLGQVYVQAKISVVDHQRMMEMVPLISRYANSQNRIEEADLAANDSFHVSLETESKRIWTPAPPGCQQTHWFYERARGQYRDAEARNTTPAQRRRFREENPVRQKLTKVDVARFINTWDGQPDVVSRGNQKNFAAFTVRMTAMGGVLVNRELFQRLVGLALIFGEAATLARAYPAYRANIVTFTIAWIARHTGQRLDLDRLWREQAVPPGLVEVMHSVMTVIQEQIVTQPAGDNVTEWCKRPGAWQHLSALEIAGVEPLQEYLVADPFQPLQAPPAAEPMTDLDGAEPGDDAGELLSSA